jgi:DedD protein
MNDHNLDDLIIDNIEPKNGKAKSMLTIVALLIVVFIVAIILTSVVLENPKSDNVLIEENDTEMVSPELTLQSAAKAKNTKEEPKLTDIIEEQLNKPIQAPKITQNDVEKVKPVKKTEAVKEEMTEPSAPETNKVQITEEFAQTPAKPEVSSLPEKVTPTETVTLAPTAKKVLEKEPVVTKLKEVVSAPKTTGIQFFIQVGSYRQSPSKRFLSVIENNGFHYHITAPSATGTKKLLIGPYTDRTKVNRALVRVRDLINKSAFVVKK